MSRHIVAIVDVTRDRSAQRTGELAATPLRTRREVNYFLRVRFLGLPASNHRGHPKVVDRALANWVELVEVEPLVVAEGVVDDITDVDGELLHSRMNLRSAHQIDRS